MPWSPLNCLSWSLATRDGHVRATDTGRLYSVDATTGSITRLTRCPYCLKFFQDKMGLVTEAGAAHRDYINAWRERADDAAEAKRAREQREREQRRNQLE